MSESAASPSPHEWDGSYPYSKCRRCRALKLGDVFRKPCRGWYLKDGIRVYVEPGAA